MAKVRSGSNCSATGTLVLASNSKNTRKSLRELPHTMFTRYYLSTPNLDANNAIGHLDMIESTTSKDSKHGSVMVLNLGQTESLAVQAPVSVGGATIGNHTVTISYNNVGTVTPVDSPLLFSKSNNTDVQPTALMVTRNRVPDPANVARRGGSQNLLHLPNMMISGWKLDLQFRSISMVDQIVTLKLIRRNGPDPVRFDQWKQDSLKELGIICNSSLTDGRHFDTLYSHTFVLKGLSQLNKATSRPHNVKKSIRANLKRSTLRKIYDPAAPMIGSMHKPHFAVAEPDATYGIQEQMNQCYLVAFAKVKDDKFFTSFSKTTAVDPVALYANTIDGIQEVELANVSIQDTLTTGYAKFKVGGTVTQFNRCASYNQHIF